MTRPTRIEVDCSTGDVTEHLLSAEEIVQRQKDAIEADLVRIKTEEEAQAKAVAKANAHAKLAKLGLTPEDIEAL